MNGTRKQADAWRPYGTVKSTDKSIDFHRDFTNIFRIFPGDGTIHAPMLPTMGVDGLLMMQSRLNPLQAGAGVGADRLSATLRGMP